MPLSAEQTQLLKTDGTEISLCEVVKHIRPKRVGSKAWDRYHKYKVATTIDEACRLGAQLQDLSAGERVYQIQRFKHGSLEQESGACGNSRQRG